jgi:hypothetical protein
MPKNVFLSFRQKNLDFRNDLRSFFEAWRGPVQATPLYLTEDVRAQGEPAIKRQIQEALRTCSGLLVVVGEDVHSSEWIDYEIAVADSWRIPRAGLRHPQAKGGLPTRFPGMEVLDWKPAAIARKVESWPSR